MHPEIRFGWFVSFPPHSCGVEKIEIPHRGTKFQRLREQMPELTLRVPGMDHLQAFEGCRFYAGPLKAVVSHHREPDCKTLQIVGAEFFQESSDNTLSVLAHGSRG